MRRVVWLAVALLLLTLAGPAKAQVAFTGMTGISPTQVQNVPVNSSLPVAAPQTVSSTTFSLSGAFARIPFPGGKPVIGQSTFPTPNALPGTSYLQAFGYQPPPPPPSALVRFRRWLFGM